ncbi:MAG: ATP-binding cassette domain-containing protein [Gammaproteobacteria bacterium]|nr:ATP-binding cassette domain-containing protein [Gammaproteobacteria bacterium]MDP2140319.1 ATP-binding cassette domain-containing protein [Gammaproteobacteria bacterium]MDP2346163.1 ATP-binding cassette domain-containing protein [Gammaproteobacteria bacterium]
MKQELLRVKDAQCRIGRHRVLCVADFAIASGEHWCVFGGNGSGKSLLSQLLCGDLFMGHDHLHYASDFAIADDVLVVSFEEQQKLWALDNRHDISEYSDTALDQGTTVSSLILGTCVADARYESIVDALDLRALVMQGIRYLSSGQVRKALIARALFRRPRLLILDDPLESVDRDSQQCIAAVLATWMTPDTATLLLCRRERDILPGITHMALMDNLTLVAQGPLAEMLAGDEFRRIAHRRVTLPRMLPQALRDRILPLPDDDVPMIELRAVNAGYQGQLVLLDFSWTMRKGQHTLIEGPNGSGKSTLLSLINGENHKAYGQEVTLFGRKRGSGESVWDVKARFGTVSNELHNKYVKGWKVLDVVVSGFFASIGLYDDSGASEHNAAKAWLRTLGVEALAGHYYHELSFGEQRLVLLARAMVKHPTILILDEPCVGLDDYYRMLILGTVDLIAATTTTHIIFVSHTSGEEPRCINQRITLRGQ